MQVVYCADLKSSPVLVVGFEILQCFHLQGFFPTARKYWSLQGILFIYLFKNSPYRKPPTISPGLIYFRKRFLMGLYKGGLIYGWAYTWTIFCVSNKQVRHKQVGHKQGNKRVLSSDYWAYINLINRGAYIRVGLYSGGLIFGMM